MALGFERLKKLSEKAMDKAFEERLTRCVPVAKLINQLLVDRGAEIKIGRTEDITATIGPIAEDAIQIMLDHNVHWTDKDFVLQLATQPIAFLTESLQSSFALSWDKAIGKKFGKDVLDLTFKEVDDVLKS